MSIQVSSLESELYKIHWGSAVEESHSSGTQLSSEDVLYGGSKIIKDYVKLEEVELAADEVAFGPQFATDGYIVGGGFYVKQRSLVAAATISLCLFSSDHREGLLLDTLFKNLNANEVRSYIRLLDGKRIVAPFSRGSFLGIKNTGNASIAGGEFCYNILYSAYT